MKPMIFYKAMYEPLPLMAYRTNKEVILQGNKLNILYYSCGLSTATIEYSCPSVCLCVCVCVCVCVCLCTR